MSNPGTPGKTGKVKKRHEHLGMRTRYRQQYSVSTNASCELLAKKIRESWLKTSSGATELTKKKYESSDFKTTRLFAIFWLLEPVSKNKIKHFQIFRFFFKQLVAYWDIFQEF